MYMSLVYSLPPPLQGASKVRHVFVCMQHTSLNGPLSAAPCCSLLLPPCRWPPRCSTFSGTTPSTGTRPP